MKLLARFMPIYIFLGESVNSLPEHMMLKVSFCDHWMSVMLPVSSNVMLQRTSPKLLAGFGPNLAELSVHIKFQSVA